MFSRIFYLISRELVRLFFLLFTRWRVKGEENIPPDGPLIVVANHLTFAEPPIIRILLPREARFATKEGFFKNRIIGAAMRSYGAFPVYQGKVDRAGIRLMENYLEQGLVVAIFPEGTRSRTAALLPALNGAALLAHRTGASILPIGIWGTEQMRKKGWFLRRPVINIQFGSPFLLPREHGRSERVGATHMIMKRIAELLPDGFRGAYAGEASGESKD